MSRMLWLVAACAVSTSAVYLPWDSEWGDTGTALGWTKARSVAGTSCSCGWVNRGRIVGGKETGRNEYPWMVSLENYGSHFCGGSILTAYHVLTAAHCTYGKKAGEMRVNVGAHQKQVTGEGKYNVEKIIQHEKYNDDRLTNDIAILVTDRRIAFSQNAGPVCLPARRLILTGETVTATGWGLTTDNGVGSRYLLGVDLPVIRFSDCSKAYKDVPASELEDPDARPLESMNLCTFKSRKDTCNGDSGGPLVWLDPDLNRYVQVALVSYGGKCGGSLPGVNTDVTAYLDWIHSKISGSNRGVQACRREG